MKHLKINKLGPIGSADIEFGDLTFFVGPQASGKSLTLEALKLAADRDSIIETLDRYNYILGHNAEKILNVYFGEGLSKIWQKDATRLQLDGEILTLSMLTKKPQDNKESSVFYVPAQRIVCMGDGYPRFFGDFTFTTPYVLREFTETLRTFVQFGLGNKKIVYPIQERLKTIQKRSFDDTIFHKGQVVMDEVAGQKKMQLSVDGINIPFMAWSAGQKEFMPLLLAFYCLSGPPSKVVKRDRYTTAIIEEPEMGLHPRAILSVLLQICELMQSGYRVVVSTHSPIMLEFAWAFNLLQGAGNNVNFSEALSALFAVAPGSPVGKMLRKITDKSVKTYYFSRQEPDGKVHTRDISSLDVAIENDTALSEWGGISEFATRVNNVVSKYLD